MMVETFVDPLTGLLSRASLERQLDLEVARALRYQQPCSLLLMDIDHFKSVNDAFGHRRGDAVLRDFARLLEAQFRKTDLLFRYGGDEFVVVLPGIDHRTAVNLGERLLVRLREMAFPGAPPLTLTASIGVVTCPDDTESREELMSLADHRHYLAKQTGRDRVVGSNTVVVRPKRREPPSRLLGRDESRQAFLQFLAQVEARGCGVMTVVGAPGSGRSHFLQAVGHLARLWGYGVFPFCGAPGLRLRRWGVLQKGSGELLPEGDDAALAQRLCRLKAEHRWRGVLILADDWHLMDEASQAQLWGLLGHKELTPLALLASGEVVFPHSPDVLHERVHLRSLTLDELRVWVRHVIQWDAPIEFLQWLHEHTQGLPREIERALDYLERERILGRREPGWSWKRRAWPEEPLTTRRGNLPLTLPLLVGRSKEMRHLAEWLGRYRLISIEGPGGVGKTRLALQVALEHQGEFRDGVYFVSLRPVTQTADIWYALASVLDISLGEFRSPAEQFRRVLHDRQMLLVLDTAETAHGLAEVVDELLQGVSGLRFLVTTRQRLHLPDERVYPLRGLAFSSLPLAGGGRLSPAVDLFVHLAQHVVPWFTLTEDNQSAIARLCAIAKGSPLLIHLMASWVSLMTPQEILAEVSRRRVFTTEPTSEVLTNQQAVVEVLQSFWEKLSDNEQQTLARLSMFPDGFDPQAAYEVAGASLFFLDALLSKGYLSRGSQQRFVMHDIMREFAAFQLRQWPEMMHTCRSHYMDYYLRQVSSLVERSCGPERVGAERLLHRDWNHIRAAFEMAVEDRNWAGLLTGLDSVFRFLGNCGQFRLAEQMLRWTLERLPSQCEEASSVMRRVRGLVYSWLGEFEYHLGEYQASLRAFEQAMACLEDGEDVVARTEVLDRKASTLRATGRFEEARELTLQAMEMYRQIGMDRRVASLLNHLGVLEYQRGKMDQAREYFSQALKSSRRTGDRGRIAAGLNNLANVAFRQDDLAQAKAWIEESLALLDGLEVGALRGSVLDTAGQIALAAGTNSEALSYFSRAIEVCVRLEAWPLLVEVLMGVGAAWIRLGDYEAAVDLLDVIAAHPEAVFEIRRRVADLRRQIPELPERERDQLKIWMTLPLEALSAEVLRHSPRLIEVFDETPDGR